MASRLPALAGFACLHTGFERFEGKRIAEPEKFAPDAGCLERHRERFIA